MIQTPIFFERNRVGRVYIGGKLFSTLFGDSPEDGYKPEEWIASAVRAINKDSTDPKEGVSKIKGEEVYFDELLEKYKGELVGDGNLRILVKALDSAIRLPAQAHPDREFSKKYFNSTFGKTECWIILGKREDAKIFFGFKDGVGREELEEAVDRSEFDPDAMERLMLTITPEIGDVYLVPAKTVHAIGYGCLILEIQEPTDFTIQPERYCGEYRLSEEEMYLGLTREDALGCFNFGEAPKAHILPTVTYEDEGKTVESLISERHTECFIINRIRLRGGEFTPNVGNSYGIYIVTGGEAKLSGEGYEKSISKGDYFFMPASLMGKFKISGRAEIVECY